MSIRVTMPCTSLGNPFLRIVVIPGALTHFQPMFDLCRNQVVGFYYQNVLKTPVEE